jgi:chromosome segregation ATPase
MTVALEEFTEWRDTVEVRLGRLESVSDEHTEKFNHDDDLLGSMDEDLSKLQVEFRAQRKMLQALHLTQSDHTARLTRLETGVRKLDGRVEKLDQRVEKLDQRVEKLDQTVEKLDGRVQRLEDGMQKVEAGVRTIIGLLDREPDDGNK